MIKIIQKIYLASLLFIIPITANAQDAEGSANQLSAYTTSSIPVLIGYVIRAALGISGVVALIMIIYGGVLWLTSGGNTDKVQKGRDTLIWAVLGLIVIFSAYAIVNAVIGFLPTESEVQ